MKLDNSHCFQEVSRAGGSVKEYMPDYICSMCITVDGGHKKLLLHGPVGLICF